ncbi:MAG: Na(+)-translocating NADH-quinone reductase subunit A [Bacteroidales bacterium]|nr:Na(+)-translocating NADH-quinone reductase subunit A [Bacteroidales bacterium]
MSNNINLKRGLDIPLKGAAALKTGKSVQPDIIAIKPADFKGFTPRLLVREGDKVLAGSPVLADKQRPDILVTSPVGGTVEQVVRGEKRKLLEVRIKVDKTAGAVDFGVSNVASMSAADVKELLLKSGLWVALVQRPYGIVADPELSPKSIFVSAFSTAPLAADTEFTLKDELANIQAGVDALSKLTKGGVHFSIKAETYSSSPFHKVENVILHTVSGKHPAGNVGVQIANIAPIRKGDTVWTVSLLLLAAIGRLLNTGKLNLERKVAVTGPQAKDPCYIDALPGISMKEIAEFVDNSNGEIRFVSGNALTGTAVGAEGALGFFDDQITLLHEGRERELLGWAKPFRTSQFSFSKAYFSWLFPKKKYAIDTNVHGGPRAFVVSDVYSKVLPIDIFPVYLIKACLAGDIDNMEKFGIYEVLPEDLALCEFVDPSKNEIQSILQDGINLMIKEMA